MQNDSISNENLVSLHERRRVARKRLDELDFPSSTDELWRYTSLETLGLKERIEKTLEVVDINAPLVSAERSTPFAQHAMPTHLPPELLVAMHHIVPRLGDVAALIVTINGRLVHASYHDEVQNKEIVITRVATLDDDVTAQTALQSFRDQHRSQDVDCFDVATESTSDYFAVFNAAVAPDPIEIRISQDTTFEKPIVLLHWMDDELAVCPRTLVRVGDSAHAVLGEYLISSASTKGVFAPVTTLEVGEAATCAYAAVQDIAETAISIHAQRSLLTQDATLSSLCIALGGHYARVLTQARALQAGSEAKLRALYFGANDQLHDFRTLQFHKGKRTTSDLLFKGAVADESRSVYSGMIRVEVGAQGTSAFQTNRNLVLSPNAHADSVPNLEIEENDVRCSHASAVGPVDDDQLYYLESRGVPTDVARRLIVIGFFQELIAQLPIVEWQLLVRERVIGKFNASDAKANAAKANVVETPQQ